MFLFHSICEDSRLESLEGVFTETLPDFYIHSAKEGPKQTGN